MFILLEGDCLEENRGEYKAGTEVEEIEEGEVTMELSMSSIVGICCHKTMKFLGDIQGEPVLVLIDSGAIDNFISTKLVDKLRLPLQETKPYRITMGDGHSIYKKGVCKGLELQLQGLQVVQTFYPFELDKVELVLGIAWLESLGEIRVNWGQQTMKIKKGKRWVCLKGDPTLAKTMVSLKSIVRTLKADEQGHLVEFRDMVREAKSEQQDVNEGGAEAQGILKDFANVCEPISGLPPHCSKDHAIMIKPGEQPANIRP